MASGGYKYRQQDFGEEFRDFAKDHTVSEIYEMFCFVSQESVRDALDTLHIPYRKKEYEKRQHRDVDINKMMEYALNHTIEDITKEFKFSSVGATRHFCNYHKIQFKHLRGSQKEK